MYSAVTTSSSEDWAIFLEKAFSMPWPYYYDMKDEEVTCVINTINEIAAETPRKKQKLIV